MTSVTAFKIAFFEPNNIFNKIAHYLAKEGFIGPAGGNVTILEGIFSVSVSLYDLLYSIALN